MANTVNDALVKVVASALHLDNNGDTSRRTEDDALSALDAIPDGWAKVGGRWVQFKTVNLGPED